MKHLPFRRRAALSSLIVALLAVSACTPSPAQLGKLLEEHPEILTGAMEKNPEKFIEAFQKAAATAEKSAGDRQVKEEQERLLKEMDGPNLLQPDLSVDRPVKGPKDAPITIVAYSDFQCPYCQQGFENLEEVFKTYPKQVRYIHKHLPLPMHPMAMPAALRYEAIALQSHEKAVQFHDEIFRNQQDLNAGGEKFLDETAKKLGVNLAKMKTDMASTAVKGQIAADTAEAEKFGIAGTPGYVVAGVALKGAYGPGFFKLIIDKKLGRK